MVRVHYPRLIPLLYLALCSRKAAGLGLGAEVKMSLSGEKNLGRATASGNIDEVLHIFTLSPELWHEI